MGEVQQSGTDKAQNESQPKNAMQKRLEELQQRKTFGHSQGTEKRG